MGFLFKEAGELGLSTPSMVMPSGGGEGLGAVSDLFSMAAEDNKATAKAKDKERQIANESALMEIASEENEAVSRLLADEGVSGDLSSIEKINSAVAQNPKLRAALDASRSLAHKRLIQKSIELGVGIETANKVLGLYKGAQDYQISGAEEAMKAAEAEAQKLRDVKRSQMVALNIDPESPDAEKQRVEGLEAAKTLQDITRKIDTKEKEALSEYRDKAHKIDPLIVNGTSILSKTIKSMPEGPQKTQMLQGLKDATSGFTSFVRFSPSVSEKEKAGYIALYNKLSLEEKKRLDLMIASSGTTAFEYASGKLDLEQADTKWKADRLEAAHDLVGKLPKDLMQEVSLYGQVGLPLDSTTAVRVFNAARDASEGIGGKPNMTPPEIDATKEYAGLFGKWLTASKLDNQYVGSVKNTISYFNDMAQKNKANLSADGWDKVVSVVSDKKALEWINAARMAGVESVDTQRYEEMYRESFKSLMSSVESRTMAHGFDSRGEARPKSVPYKDLVKAVITSDGLVKFEPSQKTPESKRAAAEANAKASPILTKTVKAYAHLMWGNTDYAGAYSMLMDISDKEEEQPKAEVKEDKTSGLNLPEDRLKFLQSLTDEDWQELMKA